eukprot:CAMPEP_0170501324 /NCGR_PEP_ID=MMETSP0208-20121228/37905_1 /TAXON_ID=197538 /ORGANISM="Strombidium inclinatum, Strain S3" /LENGTH=68 /DNA_ID=CAMNT_0010779793 /DNA_START=578 /DNA_END=784 /DNA_ORIENTATION=+
MSKELATQEKTKTIRFDDTDNMNPLTNEIIQSNPMVKLPLPKHKIEMDKQLKKTQAKLTEMIDELREQ